MESETCHGLMNTFCNHMLLALPLKKESIQKSRWIFSNTTTFWHFVTFVIFVLQKLNYSVKRQFNSKKSLFFSFASWKKWQCTALTQKVPFASQHQRTFTVFNNNSKSEQEAKVNLATWWCQMCNNDMFIH